MKLARTIELPKPAKQPGENACQSVTVSHGRPLARDGG